jgi:DNA-binding MarR family transcriptional regulator
MSEIARSERGGEPVATLLRRSVSRLARRLRAERGDSGVPASGLAILARLLRSGGATASALAALERVQPQSMTRVLNDLDAAGLISREPDAADRRQSRLRLTAKGRDLLIEDARRKDAWLARALVAELTEAERELLRIAARLMDRLADVGETDPPGEETPKSE